MSPESDDFWVLAAALKRFVDNEGKGSLPVEVGNLPASLPESLLAVVMHHDGGNNPVFRLHIRHWDSIAEPT